SPCTLPAPVAVVPASGAVALPVGEGVSLRVTVRVALVPVPVTIPAMVPPLAVKLRFVLTVAVVVGANRTFTAWVAPTPLRVNGLPDTMLKGAQTSADTET